MGNAGAKPIDFAQMMGGKKEVSHYTLTRIWVLCSQKDSLKAKDFLEILRKIEQESKVQNLPSANLYFQANRRKKTGWKLSRKEFFSLCSPYVLLAFPGSTLEPQTSQSKMNLFIKEEGSGGSFSEKSDKTVGSEVSEGGKRKGGKEEGKGKGEEKGKRKGKGKGRGKGKGKGKKGDSESEREEDFLPAEGGDSDFDFDDFQEGSDNRLEMLRRSLGNMSLDDDNDNNHNFFDDNSDFDNLSDFEGQNGFFEPKGALYGSFGEDGEWGEEEEEGGGRGRPGFALLEKREVYEGLAKKAKDAGEIFNLSRSTAIQVLSRIQWNVALIAETESIEGFLAENGASIDPCPRLKLENSPCCITCFFEPETEEELSQVFALSCGHVSCFECWEVNIATKLEAYTPNQIKCSYLGCDLCLLEEHVALLGGKAQLQRYKDQMIEMYIYKNQRLLHCPNPACPLIIEYKGHGRTEQVYCKCGGIFCFNCITEKISTEGKGHFPATCQEYKGWLTREEGGSKPSRARQCPKCSALIIKCGCEYGEVQCAGMDYCPNQACNHMSCPMCAHDFCWICMGDWSKHGTSWYNCQFVDPDLIENQTYVGTFRMFSLKYDDYEKNAMSFASRLVLLREILGSPQRLQELASSWNFPSSSSSSSSWSPFPSTPPSFSSFSSFSSPSFNSPEELLLKVAEAYEELSFCYHVLKNTFIIQYFLKDPDADIPPHFQEKKMIELFDYKQKELENYTQMLSIQVEDKYKTSLRAEWKMVDFSLEEAQNILNLVKIMRNYRLNLFEE